jgi:hypothetical protein
LSNPTSNFNWQMPTNTDLVSQLPADFEVFGQAVDTSLMDLKGGTTGQVLSKASNTDMDFTWAASSGISATIFDVKGDLIAASAPDTAARLAAGANGTILTADSGETTGLKWAAAGGMTLLTTTNLSGTSTTSATFATSYKELVCHFYGVSVSSASGIGVQVNSNTGSNYGDAYLSDSNTTFSINAGASSFRLMDYIASPPGYAVGSLTIPQYGNSSLTTKSAFVTQSNTIARRMINLAYITETTAISSLTFGTFGSGANMVGTILIYGVN